MFRMDRLLLCSAWLADYSRHVTGTVIACLKARGFNMRGMTWQTNTPPGPTPRPTNRCACGMSAPGRSWSIYCSPCHRVPFTRNEVDISNFRVEAAPCSAPCQARQRFRSASDRIASHVIGYYLSQETRVLSAADDVASIICQAEGS